MPRRPPAPHPLAREAVPGRAREALPALVREAVLDAAAVVLPVSCAGCGADGRSVCRECLAALAPQPLAPVTLDAANLAGSTVSVTASARYERVMRAVIVAVKENGRRDAATPVALALAASVHRALEGVRVDAGAPAIEIAMVPSSASAYRARGFDPVALLVRRGGLPGPARVLRRARSTVAQKSLDSAARARNAHGSLAARSRLDGRFFLLVDDVVTTGSTLAEATRAITAAGGNVVAAAAAAATPRRSSNTRASDDITVSGD
ncbi:ComF family protein [Marisediminicola sp. LYQ85]|uniref:ComF family protein n=1 Tax=Marisediminicola sp. LYQ85 TaxID=3391062 RepID=UPI0039832B09